MNFIPNESPSKTEFRRMTGHGWEKNELQKYGKFQVLVV
jgi:hypothetical protein